MTDGAWRAFRQQVFEDPALAARLARLASGDFAKQVAAAAQARGFQVEEVDVSEAVNIGRREWLERWL